MNRGRYSVARLNYEVPRKRAIPYLHIIALATIQLLLSPFLLCYGIFLINLTAAEFYTPEQGIWTAILYISSYKICNVAVKSYCRYLERTGRKVYKRNVIRNISALLTILTITIYMNPSSFIQITVYGLVGGILTSFTLVYLRFYTKHIFKGRQFDILFQIVQPLSLFFTPYLIQFLRETYGIMETQVLVSTFALNVIPVIMLIRTRARDKMQPSLYKCSNTLASLPDIEMSEVRRRPSISSCTSSSDSEDETYDLEEPPPTQIYSHLYYNTNYNNSTSQILNSNGGGGSGITILPEIEEEDEDEDDDDINEINSKRLSRISAVLQNLHKDSRGKDLTLSVTNLYQPDMEITAAEIGTEIDNNQQSTTPPPTDVDKPEDSNGCLWISPNTRFKMRTKRRRLGEFLREHLTRSVPRTLSTLYFYPALICSSVTGVLCTIFIVGAPTIALEKSQNHDQPLEVGDAVFLLTIIGFGWIFCLAGYPVYKNFSAFKTRLVFIVGMLILASSIFVAKKLTNDNLTVSCLLFGMGYGIVTFTEDTAYRELYGETKWRKGQSALEISTALTVILIYFVIYLCNVKINTLLNYGHWPYVFNAALWTFTHAIKIIAVATTRAVRHRREQSSNFY